MLRFLTKREGSAFRIVRGVLPRSLPGVLKASAKFLCFGQRTHHQHDHLS